MALPQSIDEVVIRLRDNVDPRTEGLFLNDRPWTIFTIIVIYLAFVKKIGPKFMENRQPFKLTTFMTIYNSIQVVACIIVLYWFIDAGVFDGNPIVCRGTDYSFEKKPYNLAITIWYCIFLKLVELLETVMFVLRKKQNQVSHLHVYHHVSTLLFTWTSSRYSAGGVAAGTIALNTFIHVIMYVYYLASVHAGESVKRKLLPFKRSLTMMQMIQFWMMVVLCTQAIFIERCSSHRFLALLFVPNVIYLFHMFRQFFIKSYLGDKNKKKK